MLGTQRVPRVEGCLRVLQGFLGFIGQFRVLLGTEQFFRESRPSE